jgi:hypothetical protein
MTLESKHLKFSLLGGVVAWIFARSVFAAVPALPNPPTMVDAANATAQAQVTVQEIDACN